MLLIDKYRPTTLKDAYFNIDVLNLLEIMSQDDAIPHIIFYGPEGAGKRTTVKMFLEMLYDKNVHKTKNVTYKVVGSGNKKTDEIVKQSDYHLVIEPKNTNFDRYLIHDIVKEYAKRRTLGIFESNKQFKSVLINNIDNMSYYAQTSLRRTMERYNDKCRFIMSCKSLSKVIKPLQSRCICIQIAAPTDSELFGYMLDISIKEKIHLSLEQFDTIIKKSKGNTKHALWELEFIKQGYELDTNYIQSISKIIKLILEKKLANIATIRDLLFSLMITNFTGTTIMRDLIDAICVHPDLSDKLKCQIIKLGADTEHQLVKGRREIIQFDAFITSAIKAVYDEKKT